MLRGKNHTQEKNLFQGKNSECGKNPLVYNSNKVMMPYIAQLHDENVLSAGTSLDDSIFKCPISRTAALFVTQ